MIVRRIRFQPCLDTLDKRDIQMEEIRIPNQGHTLACMLRTYLFDNGASFAACTVPHPLNSDLTVKIQCDGTTPKECLQASLRDAAEEVEAALKVVRGHIAHTEAMNAPQ